MQSPDHLNKLLGDYQNFLRELVMPLEPLFLQGGFGAVEERLGELRNSAKDAELWLPQMPRDLGGLGLDMLEFGFVSEILGQSPMGHYVFGCQAPNAGNMELLHLFGSEEQKKRYLRPLCEGKIRSCFSMTEKRTSGANPTQLSSRAEIRRDGKFIIEGEKWFTTAFDGAAFTIVMVVTDPEAAKHRRSSMLIVPTDAKGLEFVRNISVMGHAGSGPYSHAELRFDGVEVGEDSLLGSRGDGFLLAQARLGPGRIHHCMRWLGIARRVLGMLVERSKSRAITSQSRLSDMPLFQSRLAELYAEYQASRLLVLDCAQKIAKHGTRHAKVDISVIKFKVARTLLDIVDAGIQAHGALGVTDDTILSWFYREERGARIYDGPDEVHKLSAGKALLSQDGF